MKTRIHQTRLSATLAGVLLMFTLATTQAQTYTWADNAQGQLYETCLVGGGPAVMHGYWPSNSFWSQSLGGGADCSTNVSAPSNFDPAPPIGVYPGGPGAVGVDVVLGAPANTIFDVNVTLNSLTIQPNGGVLGSFGNTLVTANTFDFQGDGSLTNVSGIAIASGGTLVKSGGTGTFDLGSGHNATGLTGHSATIAVKSGTLVFPQGNNDTSLNGGGTFAISNNATLILAQDINTGTSLVGDFTGGGGGTVLLTAGNLISGYGYSLDFPGNMFQWTGGGLWGGYVTNIGTINISNQPAMNAFFYNYGTVKLADGSALNVYNAFFNNQSGGILDFQGDASLAGAAPLFNSGLLKKSAGTGVSQIFPQFQNYGGTVEVDSGTLAVSLGGNGNVISNATFVVQSGATFDLSISNNNTRIGGVLTGSGGGTVFMNSGTVYCDTQQGAATLNFPGAMFQWAGGTLGGESSVFLTNAGTINLSGPVVMDTFFANNGTIIQAGAGSVGGGGGRLANNVGGDYQIQNDNGVAIDYFYNYGLLEKTGGSGTSVISATFNNSGAIQPASGTLLFTRGVFNQNAGTLQITPAITFTNSYFSLNGGMVTGVGTVGENLYAYGGMLAPGNPFGTLNVPFDVIMNSSGAFNVVLGGTNQFSQLAAGYASLNGTLNVTLTNGYVPAIGTQFQIVSCLNMGWGFTVLNVPQGISVNYSNNGVYLIVTGSTPVQLQSPKISGGNFAFSFATTNGLGYTVQQNTNLATTNWVYYMNIIGNGSLYQFTTPLTNIPQRFFRVSQP